MQTRPSRDHRRLDFPTLSEDRLVGDRGGWRRGTDAFFTYRRLSRLLGLYRDDTRVQQVVWNLLTNAVKFSPKDSTIDVGVRRVHSMAQVTVVDRGAGIDPAFLPHVFERFRQSEEGSRRQQGGLWLGLSIVRHLVEMHGGRVSVRSEGMGSGATFIVRLSVRALGKGYTVRDLPAIALTAYARQQDRQRALMAGYQMHVVKPVDPHELTAVVASVAGRTG